MHIRAHMSVSANQKDSRLLIIRGFQDQDNMKTRRYTNKLQNIH